MHNCPPFTGGERVLSLGTSSRGYAIQTDAQRIDAALVVVATGQCARSNRLSFSRHVPEDVRQLSSLDYTTPDDCGVLIVGTRVAGAATALRLVRGGANVLIVERDTKIGDTLSTHALMRPAIQLLSNCGVLEAATKQTLCVSRTTFHYGPKRIAIPIKSTSESRGCLHCGGRSWTRLS